MNNPIYESVWSLTEPDLIQLAQLANRLLELRRSFASDTSVDSESIKSTQPSRNGLPVVDGAEARMPAPKQLPPRGPLKGPRPGSLRGDVHSVLREAANALSRAEVSRRVARLRGVNCDDAHTNKVGEILRCPHDNRIKKLRHGIYRYVH